MFFRVRLCLEGIPVHAWNPEIVERLIGRSYALECIDTDLLHPDDTRTIDVWAWTPNPSKIPKCLWMVVTGRGDASSSVTITMKPPAPWMKGAQFRVLIHLEWIHDYTSASTDHFGEGGLAAPEPERRRLPWHRGAVDGEPAPQAEFPLFNVPPPVWKGGQDRREEELRRVRQGGSSRRGDAAKDDRARQQPWYNNDHPRHTWERHLRHDEHDDDGNPGAHGSRSRSIRGAGNVGQEPVFRVRDRSPPRRNWGSGHDGRHRDASPPAPIDKLVTIRDLRAENDARLRFLFRAQAASMQDVTNNLVKNHSVRLNHDLVIPAMNNYINKALWLADKLGIDDEPIPAPVFVTGNEALSSGNAVAAAPRNGEAAGSPLELAQSTSRWRQPSRGSNSTCRLLKMAAAAQASADLQLACISAGQPASPASVIPPSPTGEGKRQLADVTHANADGNDNDNDNLGLDVFFTTPPPPAIRPGPEVLRQVQVRRRRTYDMSKVRRGARLAAKPAMPALKKAQINLCHQLGLIADERAPIEKALIDYINMYKGPLPQDVVAALSTFFGIHDEFAIQLDEAMMGLAGVGIDDVQEVINEADE
ncbi:hypothetical protein PVAP13_2KG232958 [Panicum virgatum]|uniref:DUF4283 domain-containing protein n=1 Tax=Panicum virgatum TaxID=38727 RepID=A0A8T0W2U0_PANVG|nr:hypothetical protein PVAP13_2KG232958 [Panicum virgatum]